MCHGHSEAPGLITATPVVLVVSCGRTPSRVGLRRHETGGLADATDGRNSLLVGQAGSTGDEHMVERVDERARERL